MQTLKTKSGHTVELYDSIDEMPMVRYHRYNQLMIIGSGEGTNLADIKSKIKAIRRLIDSKRDADAKVELANLEMQFAMVAANIDVRSRAFACLVKSIDGKECADITSDGLRRTAERLDEIVTIAERDGASNSVKKKIEGDIKFYYPERDNTNHSVVNSMRRRLELMLDEIISGEDKKSEIAAIDSKLDATMEVMNYTAFERDSDVAFEQGCLSIQDQLKKDPKTMTVMEYYAATKLLEERAKKLETKLHNH